MQEINIWEPAGQDRTLAGLMGKEANGGEEVIPQPSQKTLQFLIMCGLG